MVWKMTVVLGMLCVLSGGVVAEIQEAPVGESATSTATHASYWSDAGYGVLATFSNIFYMPAKVVYAGVGLLTGSLGFVLTAGDGDIARSIWSPSLGGTYVITPGMLRGHEEILFSGPSYSND
jgi:hypothetical protein